MTNGRRARRSRPGCLLRTLPPGLAAAARSVDGAADVLCCLMLDERETVRQRQLEALADRGGEPTCQRVALYHAVVADNLRAWRLPLLELALPRLRELPPERLSALHRTITALIAADGRLSVFELLLATWLQRLLSPPGTR